MSNKVNYGLKNTHYAVVTEANGVVSYGTPKPWPGAVNLILSAAGENVTFYADDHAYFEENTNNGYEGSIEMALIPDAFRTDVLGDIIDGNGALIENANAKPKKFALMYEHDGDAKKTRHVLYSVLPTRPNLDRSTRTNTKEPKTETMNISARPALDTRDVKAKVKQGDTGYDTFFTAVYLKDAVVNTAGANPADFSKAAAADVEVTTTSSGTTAIKNVLLNGLPVPGVSLTIAALKATIDSSYVSGLALANGDYPIVVEFTKGNSVLYTLTVTA